MRSRSVRCSVASACSTSLSSTSSVAPCDGNANVMDFAAPCSLDTGPTSSVSTMFVDSVSPPRWTSCVEGSLVRTRPMRGGVLASSASAPVCGRSTRGSSAKCDPRSRSSKTSAASNGAASTSCSPTSATLVTRHDVVDLPRVTSAHRIADCEFGFWPTPTREDYGSSQNGSNAWRPSGGTPSISTRVREDTWWPIRTGRQVPDPPTGPHGLLATLVVNPVFIERLLGAPEHWTALDDDSDLPLLAMLYAPSKPPLRSSDL